MTACRDFSKKWYGQCWQCRAERVRVWPVRPQRTTRVDPGYYCFDCWRHWDAQVAAAADSQPSATPKKKQAIVNDSAHTHLPAARSSKPVSPDISKKVWQGLFDRRKPTILKSDVHAYMKDAHQLHARTARDDVFNILRREGLVDEYKDARDGRSSVVWCTIHSKTGAPPSSPGTRTMKPGATAQRPTGDAASTAAKKPSVPDNKKTATQKDKKKVRTLKIVGRYAPRVLSQNRGDRPYCAGVEYVRPLELYPLPLALSGLAAEEPLSREEHRKRHHIIEAALEEYLEKTSLPAGTTVVPDRWHALLFTEDVQVQHALAFYGTDKAELQVHRDLMSGRQMVKYDVDGLAEKRPSVLRGDRVHIQDRDQPSSQYFEGYVHDIAQAHIVLSFHATMVNVIQSRPSARFNLMFVASRVTQRAMHRAVDVAPLFDPTALSRERSCLATTLKSDAASTVTRHPISLNVMQRSFIDSVVRPTLTAGSVAHSRLKLLWGPPGTGKTTTLVATIMELLDSYPDIRLLVCAPSNAACDEIIEKVDKYGRPSDDLIKFLRVNALGRSVDVPSTVRKYCTKVLDDGFEFPTVSQLKHRQVTVVTLITAAKLYGIGVENFFDMLIVDEAAQASEPELQCAISCIKPDAGIILCGDHKQLGCVLHSTLCQQSELAISPLERACDAVPHAVTQLVDNYRSHSTIVRFLNLHYDDTLVARANDEALQRQVSNRTRNPLLLLDRTPPIEIVPGRPIAFLHIVGQETRSPDSPSWMNGQEVIVVQAVIRHLIKDRDASPKDIAVLSPYQKQTRMIRGALRALWSDAELGLSASTHQPSDLVVSSVEAFQGQERKIIIVSTVRSREHDKLQHDAKHNLGFVGQPRRVNVALSRPQAMLIVVGNMNVLSMDDSWWRAISLAREMGCLHSVAGCVVPAERWTPPAANIPNDASDDEIPVNEVPAAVHGRDN